MNKTIKMFIETADGKKLEQEIPEGLVEIYFEKGWKRVTEEEKKSYETLEEPIEKSFFSTKKNKFKK